MLPISGDKLTQLIPQKPPFVLISTLHEVDAQHAITTFNFTADHVMCSNGRLTQAGILENMAQTAGCGMGYLDFMAGKPGRPGFIGDVKDFICHHLPAAGEELRTEIIIEKTVFGSVTLMQGKVWVGNTEVASCKMKVFFEPEPEQ